MTVKMKRYEFISVLAEASLSEVALNILRQRFTLLAMTDLAQISVVLVLTASRRLSISAVLS